MTKEYDPLDIIAQIRGNASQRNAAIRLLVRDGELKRKIAGYVIKNSGDQMEAETVFHDSIVTFVKTAFTRKDFELSVHLHGYMMGVARNVWMNALRKNKRNITVPIEQSGMDESLHTDNMDLLLKGERGKILKVVLDQMRKKCKEVLMHWASGFKMDEIAKALDYKSGNVVKKKKSECMKELYAYLRDNPHIKERIRPV